MISLISRFLPWHSIYIYIYYYYCCFGAIYFVLHFTGEEPLKWKYCIKVIKVDLRSSFSCIPSTFQVTSVILRPYKMLNVIPQFCIAHLFCVQFRNSNLTKDAKVSYLGWGDKPILSQEGTNLIFSSLEKITFLSSFQDLDMSRLVLTCSSYYKHMPQKRTSINQHLCRVLSSNN